MSLGEIMGYVVSFFVGVLFGVATMCILIAGRER